MTEKELKNLYWLNREAECLQKELADIEFELENSGYRGNRLRHTPAGNCLDACDKICSILDQKHMLKESIELNLKKIQHERARLERYIRSIEDAEIRLIFRLRCINCMDWEDIAAEMIVLNDDGNVVKKPDRTTVSKKYYKFLRNSHISRGNKI